MGYGVPAELPRLSRESWVKQENRNSPIFLLPSEA
jgi:hypothetical protein